MTARIVILTVLDRFVFSSIYSVILSALIYAPQQL